MLIKSKVQRSYWINSLLGFIPDIIVAVIITWFSGDGFAIFLVSFLGLQILYFLIWIKNSIWLWVLFKYRDREFMVNHLLNYLKQNKYPEPEDFIGSAEEYFQNIVSNEFLPIDLRLKANAEMISINYPSQQGQFQQALRISMAYEEAIEKYKNICLQKHG